MSDLHSQIDTLVNQLVGAVMTAVKQASIENIAEHIGQPERTQRRERRGNGGGTAAVEHAAPVRRGSRGRRARATTEEVQGQKDAVMRAAKSLAGGFSKRDVMKKAGSQVDLGRALGLLVTEGKLTRKGDRRLARYWIK